MKPTLSSRQLFIVIIVLLTLALVACERPLNGDEATPTQETPADTPPDGETLPEEAPDGEAPPTLVPTKVPPGPGEPERDCRTW